jgi:hypothetical protein
MNPVLIALGVLLVLTSAWFGYAAAWDEKYARLTMYVVIFVGGVLCLASGIARVGP